MQAGTSFGRKRMAPVISAPKPLATPRQAQLPDLPVVPAALQPDPMDRELEQWTKPQKSRARLLAEPWRSLTIVASVGFGFSSWMLPDAVQDVTQVVMGVLTAGGLIAGRRKSKRLAAEAPADTEPAAR